MILTPWKEFKTIDYQKSDLSKKLKVIIDPYGILKKSDVVKQGYKLLTLGKSENIQ
jgi:hypothetical protein